MTANDITALRAKACAITAALGAVLDDLQTAEETLANPSSGPADVLARRSLLGNAATAAESLVGAAHELALGIERHRERQTLDEYRRSQNTDSHE